MSTALGSLDDTRDPARLVPGSADDVLADAREIDAQASALDLLSEGATRSTATPSWSGAAAAGWAHRREQLVPAPSAVAAAYRAAAAALRSHAAALTWARSRALMAIRLWEGDPTSCSPVDTRALALAVLVDARAGAAASARALARALDGLGDGLPDGQFHADDFFAGLWDWASQLGSSLLESDPMRSAYDPAEYWRHQYDQAAGAIALTRAFADDPGDTVSALVDTRGLDDEPGRWWGRLAPDVVLTVGSAGTAALAGRSASVVGRAAAIAEPPPLVIEVLGTEPSPYVRISTDDSWANALTLEKHVSKHAHQFGATSADEYAGMASEFFQRAVHEGLPTRIDSDGTIRVYEPSTNTFGSFDASGRTRTFFRPSSSTYWERQDGILLP